MPTKTVLFADDQLFLFRGIISKLKEIYDVVTVKSGRDALERINRGGLDLIILDNYMPPEPEGNYIALLVHEQYPHIPVVLQTDDYQKYGYLEEFGIKVMGKADREGIFAYVKQTLGE